MLEAPAGFLVDELLELALGDLQPLVGVGMLGVRPLDELAVPVGVLLELLVALVEARGGLLGLGEQLF